MAITTFQQDVSAFFPAGTSLEARPASNWPAHKRPPEAGTAPVGAATATAVSNATTGVLTLAGLADSTEYFVSDAGGTRYVRITTFPERQEVMTNTPEYRTALAVTKEHINPFDPQFAGGAPEDGTDGTAAWLAANAAMFTATKGEIVIPKQLVLSPSAATTPVRVPPTNDPAKRYVWRCEGEGHVKLSANMPTAVQPGRTADQQTFRGLHFIDFAVDADNVNSPADVIFGPYDSGGIGVLGQRVNYKDIRFIRPRAWNVNAGGSGGNQRRVIQIASRHVYTNEGDANWNPNSKTQNTITDILVEDPQFDGGDYGVAIYAALQRGATSGMRIKNFSGTPSVINYVGLTGAAPPANDWIFIGTGQWFERHRIAAISDNGDGTGSITLEAALTFAQPTDDGTGANKGAPMVSGYANVWLDRLNVEGGYIHLGTGAYGSAIQYVGVGIAGHDLYVSNIDLEGSGDNNLEVDTALGFHGKGIHSKNPGNESFMVRNFNIPQDQSNQLLTYLHQVHEYSDCTHEIDGIQPTTSVPGVGWYAGYNWTAGHTPAGATPMFGTLRFRNCKAIDKSPQWRAIKGGAVYCGNDCSISRIEGDVEYIKTQASDSAATTPKPFYITPASSTTVAMKQIVKLAGSATGGNPTLSFLEPFTPYGQTSMHDLLADVDLQVRSSLTGISPGGHFLMAVGEAVTDANNKGTFHGRLGIQVVGWSGADTQPKPFRWNTGGNLTILERVLIDGCDFSKLPTTAQIHTFQGSVPVAFQRKITHTRRNILLGTFSNFTGSGQFLGSGSGFQEYDVTPGASPWTFVNETTLDLRVRVTGGTVSAVDFSYNSGTTFQTGKLPTAFDSFILRPGEAIKVTYTVAPSVFAWPLL